MAIYIKGMGNISPQKTWDEPAFLTMPLEYSGNRLSALEPDYSVLIDAKQIRRMSRIIKMGVAAASKALKESNVSIPDAIITATGYGCLDDTGIFLSKMVGNSEAALNPTPFIQSTHNTIGSQIALLLQCQGYNQTYVHGAFSFESVLLDTLLQCEEEPAKNILIGGIDEITILSHRILERFGIFKKEAKNVLDIFNTKSPGTIDGEGSAFFVVSGEPGQNDVACIRDVATFYKPHLADLKDGIKRFLLKYSEKIDLVLLGKSGDAQLDSVLDHLSENMFAQASSGVFKHLSGEYPVASAFGCWLAANILKEGTVPQVVLQRDKERPVKTILILNHYFGTHYSMILLGACSKTR